jgi:hypothetical protein
MGAALIGETNSLFQWLSTEGFGPFAISVNNYY